MKTQKVKQALLIKKRLLPLFSGFAFQRSLAGMFFLTVLFVPALSFSQDTATNNDDKFIDVFFHSLGISSPILFEGKNIKQYWTEKTVMNKDGLIYITLDKKDSSVFESNPLKIQLANVDESLDCRVDVLTSDPNVSFSVANSKQKSLSQSSENDSFLQYHAISSSFHLEDAEDFSFVLRFQTKNSDIISIKKICLSFSKNKYSTYLTTPGSLRFTPENISSKNEVVSDNKGFQVSGTQTQVFSKYKIFAADNKIQTSVKLKNIGNQATRILIGFAGYSKDHIRFDDRNFPYKNINNILNVVSSEANSNSIIVDSYPQWQKNCFLALEAKEDLSDIPNNNFPDGKIADIKELSNGQAEIILDAPLNKALSKGTKVRVHGRSGAFLYTNDKVLQPGEEETFTSVIQKDDSFLQFSPKAFSRNVYYVVPLILSYSQNPAETNTVLISDYSISY